MKNKPIIVFILGPTGVGKSDLAVRFALKVGGEIISCDSMQIYKGMAIMSQQPNTELRRTIPHHLVGILSPSKEWNAAAFIEKAKGITGDIVRRGNIPIIAGGSTLYARAFIKGLFPSPPGNERLRKALYKKAKGEGKKVLYERLLKIDPIYASRIHPNDLRRIIRALEVYELTGKPISEKQSETKGIEDEFKILIFVLNRERQKLYKRIDERVEEMFAKGVVKEVKRLKKRKLSRTAKAALGYKEISDYTKGRCSLQEAKDFLKRNTRNYAKRQLTWFRKEHGAQWLTLSTAKKDTTLLNTIVKNIQKTIAVEPKTRLYGKSDISYGKTRKRR